MSRRLPPNEGQTLDPGKTPLVPGHDVQTSADGSSGDEEIVRANGDAPPCELSPQAGVGSGSNQIEREDRKPRKKSLHKCLSTRATIFSVRSMNTMQEL